MQPILKKSLAVFLSLLLVLSVFSGCSTSPDSGKASASVGIVDTVSGFTVVSPVGETVDLHTKAQARFLNGNYKNLAHYASGKKEKSHPEAVEFKWTYQNAQDGVTQYTLCISESPDMQNVMSCTTSEQSILVYNLKIATAYYWTVTADGVTSPVAEFSTADAAPRNLYVDGITNVRDLGGWMTESGTRTRQGMLFRCGRLNESSAEEVNIEITEAGKRTMLEFLGVKTEIDIRKADGETGGITASPLGDSVAYYNIPMDWEGDTFNGNREALLRVFSILADEENYPVIFHCNIGTDRTGVIAYLVGALLGVPEEDLYKDYLFSNFGKINGQRHPSGVKDSAYYQAVAAAEGDALQEKAYNCLAEFGVPRAQLDSIIRILSEQ